MINALFDSSTIPLLAKSAAFAERRHEVLSGNIANISTPDYRTRDLPVAEFQQALREAVARRQQPDRPATDNWSFASSRARSIEELIPARLMQSIEAPARSLTFQDGNNRSIENEAMELTKNSLLQQVAIELMMLQMNRLQAVISERP